MKVGVVVVTHHGLGREFVNSLQQIVPSPPDFRTVAIDPDQSVDEMRNAIARELQAAEQGMGVLVLTDMFGGTPSNISLSFMKEHRVEVVTGVNLPMLVRLSTADRNLGVGELGKQLQVTTRRCVCLREEMVPAAVDTETGEGFGG